MHYNSNNNNFYNTGCVVHTKFEIYVFILFVIVIRRTYHFTFIIKYLIVSFSHTAVYYNNRNSNIFLCEHSYKWCMRLGNIIKIYFNTVRGPSWPWSYGGWIYNYICNQCLSPLMLWVRLPLSSRITTLCDKVCQWLVTGRWFYPGTLVSSTNKTDRHGIAEILLKVALSTIKPNQTII
jgi:hypothetical protein